MVMKSQSPVFGTQAKTIAILWGGRAQPRRGRKPRLSLDRIVQAAIGLADADGLAAVSMERLAKEFSLTTMSLYRYVPGKSGLVDLMIDTGLGLPPALDVGGKAWRDQLDRWAHAIWDTFHRHPWALEATGRLRLMGPNELEWFEAALRALSTTSLTRAERHAACHVVLSQVRGMAQFSITVPDAPRHIAGDRWTTATRQLLNTRGAQYPELGATLGDSRELKSGDELLSFGLKCALDGISLLIERRRSKRTVSSRRTR